VYECELLTLALGLFVCSCNDLKTALLVLVDNWKMQQAKKDIPEYRLVTSDHCHYHQGGRITAVSELVTKSDEEGLPHLSSV
jgi:hypothetical protein